MREKLGSRLGFILLSAGCREEDSDITAEDIAFLKSLAEEAYPLKDYDKEAIYGAVAQSFSDGENFQIIENDIIGMTSSVLEGNFKIFIGKKSVHHGLSR